MDTSTAHSPGDPRGPFLQRSFRAGSGYRLVVFDRLPLEEQAALAELRADPEFYGVLAPREGSHRTVKAVGRDTALLWLTLTEPGPLPFFVWSSDAGAAVQGITELVLDGVLEISDGEGFVAGPAAAGLLLPARIEAPQGALARLSAEALRHAEALRLDDPGRIALSLYGYNRQPVTPAWARRLPDRAAVLDFLGAAPGTPLGRRLTAGWERAAGAAEPEGWIAWRLRRRNGRAVGRGGRGSGSGWATFKLYLSPGIEALPAAFAAVVETLEGAGAGDFKVGCDAAGLLRPDKLVLYFQEREELLAAAGELERRLPGLPAQGVPFTAEIGLDGALSWGMDPPKSARLVSWHEGESWRIWVVRRLASALLAAREGGPVEREKHQAERQEGGLAPWQFALERLLREGVDVDRWTPAAHLWQAA